MLGIVAALGITNPSAAANSAPVDSESSSTAVVEPRITAPDAVTVSQLSNQPIQLTATPVVRAAQPVPAPARATPVARTNGSR